MSNGSNEVTITEKLGGAVLCVRLRIECQHVSGGTCGPCSIPALEMFADALMRYGHERGASGRGLPVVERTLSRLNPDVK